ncbi:MAG: hypothetical protein RL095_2739 [Verrucomicrobiota bacterium]
MIELFPEVQDGQILVIFDGDCGLCSRAVRFLHRNDREHRIWFVPGQSPRAAELLRRQGADLALLQSTLMVWDGEDLLLRSQAACRAAACLAPPWSLLRGFRLLPLAWRDAAYDALAKRRHRLFKPVCELPAPSLRQRILA